jgi:hypothetical protein
LRGITNALSEKEMKNMMGGIKVFALEGAEIERCGVCGTPTSCSKITMCWTEGIVFI